MNDGSTSHIGNFLFNPNCGADEIISPVRPLLMSAERKFTQSKKKKSLKKSLK
jgi:hypothetical protein